jgi:hypothetical protein
VDEALQVGRLKGHVFGRSMNAGNFAALAMAAGLLALAVQTSKAAEGPLAHFAGNWSGNGKITVQNGSSERIRCRSSNTATSNGLGLTLRCASDSYKFDLASDITSDGGNLSGSWNETTRGVVGSLSGKATTGNINATASAVGFNAALAIRATGNSLSVSIRSPGSEISEVSIVMARGGR